MTHRQLRITLFAVLFFAVMLGITIWQWKSSEKKAVLSTAALTTVAVPKPEPIAVPEPIAKPVVVAAPPLPVHPRRHLHVIAPQPAPLDIRLLQYRVPETAGNIELRRTLLPDLFAPSFVVEPDVKFGGNLILDDDPKANEVPMRERVKGAEVRVEVKLN